MTEHPLRIFSGSANRPLAQEIADILQVPLGRCTTTRLPDSEIHVMIDEVVRGQDIFFIQPCSAPVNEHLMELILYVDAFRRASAHRVNVVIPYFPYARQERMARGREAISARVVANMLENAGIQRVLFVDIHARAIQGFFNVPVDPLSAVPILADYLRSKQEYNQAAVVSPDVGRASMAGKYAEILNLPLVVMHKRRTGPSATHTTHVVGEIEGKRPIIIDDLVAGGSVLKQIDALFDHGAVGPACFAISHPVLLPVALEYLDDPRIGELVVTNTIYVPPEKRHPKLKILSIAGLLTDVIQRIHTGQSISPLLVIQ